MQVYVCNMIFDYLYNKRNEIGEDNFLACLTYVIDYWYQPDSDIIAKRICNYRNLINYK